MKEFIIFTILGMLIGGGVSIMMLAYNKHEIRIYTIESIMIDAGLWPNNISLPERNSKQ